MWKSLYGTQMVESILAFEKNFFVQSEYGISLEVIKVKHKCHKRDLYYKDNLKEEFISS